MAGLTGEELAALPVGSIVKLDGDEGEIIKSGSTVHIIWPEGGTRYEQLKGGKTWFDDDSIAKEIRV